jgi:hypothetical protein
MPEIILSDEVRRLILEHIDSIAALEALLLLHKYPEQNWTAEAVARRFYVSETAATEVLVQLAADGLCVCGDKYFRYGPSSKEQAAAIDALRDAYAQYLIPVTNLVHNKSTRIQKFADAFRIRRDK